MNFLGQFVPLTIISRFRGKILPPVRTVSAAFGTRREEELTLS